MPAASSHLVDGAVNLDVHIVANLEVAQVGGQGNVTMVPEPTGKHVPGAAAQTIGSGHFCAPLQGREGGQHGVHGGMGDGIQPIGCRAALRLHASCMCAEAGWLASVSIAKHWASFALQSQQWRLTLTNQPTAV